METAAARTSRVWFITGASRGLGHAFTEAALAAGDRVVGVARDVSPLDDLATRHPGRLLALRLDVTDRAAVHTSTPSARSGSPRRSCRRCGPKPVGTLCRFPASERSVAFPAPGSTARARSHWRAWSEAWAAEAAPFGVKVTIVQPGGYCTDLCTSSRATTANPTYDPLRAELAKQWAEGPIDSEPYG